MPEDMRWDPTQYHRFATERAQPFHDLMSLVLFSPRMRILDLGCGSGELTARLRDASSGSIVEGVDSSPAMIARARRQEDGQLRFVLGDLAAYGEPGSYDLVFSNAALHWVEDHASLVDKLLRLVRPGGQIAWQIPSNHHHPAHALIASELVTQEPYRSMLGGYVRRTSVLELDEYARLLFAQGARDIVAMERAYVHELESVAQVVDWTRATTLLPYLERLPGASHEEFLGRYRDLLMARWGKQRPYGYTFRRILLRARAGSERAHDDPSDRGSAGSSRSQIA